MEKTSNKFERNFEQKVKKIMSRGWTYIGKFIQFSEIHLFNTIIKYKIFQYISHEVYKIKYVQFNSILMRKLP